MNTVKKSFRVLSALLIFAVSAFMISCSEDETLATADKSSVSSEASTDSYFEDAEDLSSQVSYADNTEFGGRTVELGDDRLACATITLSEGATPQAGVITIDFGDGCTRNEITRKGKIIINYEGERRTVGSSHTITFDGFYVNGVKIEGTRTVEVSEKTNTSITHEITLTGGKITWDEGTPNETSATRSANHLRKWDRKETGILDDEVRVLTGGTATGINRDGVEYSMQITQDIVFKASCLPLKRFLPVAGEKVLSVGGNSGREITVNYGSGDCDNMITVTINGQSKTVTVNRG